MTSTPRIYAAYQAEFMRWCKGQKQPVNVETLAQYIEYAWDVHGASSTIARVSGIGTFYRTNNWSFDTKDVRINAVLRRVRYDQQYKVKLTDAEYVTRTRRVKTLPKR